MKKKKEEYIQSADKHEGAFIAHVEPQYPAELQKDEAPEVDYPEPQHLVKLQTVKAKVDFVIKPQTSDGHSEFDFQTLAAGQAFFSCSSCNYWQAYATPYFHA